MGARRIVLPRGIRGSDPLPTPAGGIVRVERAYVRAASAGAVLYATEMAEVVDTFIPRAAGDAMAKPAVVAHLHSSNKP